MKMDEVFRYTFIHDCDVLPLSPHRLRSIKKEISNVEMAAVEKTKRRLEDEKMAPYQTQRLGKHR